ncbi:MAG: hypothetical protein JSW12_01845 [Deltaproteobacteria bacterium]|nr:MAG: hypothetical protein JSW12_01845 [Deltaproteobacteria bacterium]
MKDERIRAGQRGDFVRALVVVWNVKGGSGAPITYLFWACLQTWDFLCGISPKERVLALCPHDRG